MWFFTNEARRLDILRTKRIFIMLQKICLNDTVFNKFLHTNCIQTENYSQTIYFCLCRSFIPHSLIKAKRNMHSASFLSKIEHKYWTETHLRNAYNRYQTRKYFEYISRYKNPDESNGTRFKGKTRAKWTRN